MNQCTWQEPDGYCQHNVEGTTEYCAKHNRMIRKIVSNAVKSQAKAAEILFNLKEKQKEPRQKIAKQSAKQKAKDTAYGIRVKEWKKENPNCKAMCSPDCTGKTRDCHHKKKRGELLMVEKYWLPVCEFCHDWIGNNSDEARRLGLTINHLEPEFTEPHII